MDQEIRNEFKRLRDFFQEHMITKEEFEQRIENLPTKQDFNQLQISVDGLAKQFQNHNQELIVGAERTSRMEAWIIKAAAKIGVQ